MYPPFAHCLRSLAAACTQGTCPLGIAALGNTTWGQVDAPASMAPAAQMVIPNRPGRHLCRSAPRLVRVPWLLRSVTRGRWGYRLPHIAWPAPGNESACQSLHRCLPQASLRRCMTCCWTGARRPSSASSRAARSSASPTICWWVWGCEVLLVNPWPAAPKPRPRRSWRCHLGRPAPLPFAAYAPTPLSPIPLPHPPRS
jgi:hypothetical protein